MYFRQAFQLMVDQPLYNQKIYKGYSVGTYGPVPSQPANSFVSTLVKDNPYPYNPSKADLAPQGPWLEGRAQRYVHLPVARHQCRPVRCRNTGQVPNCPSTSNTPAD